MKCIIQTERLDLRELAMYDLPFVSEMLGDAQVMRFWPRPFTREESTAWIERQQSRYENDGCGYWLAVDRELDQPVGQVGVMLLDVDGAREPALGYIIHRPFQRRGYAAEGARACIAWAGSELSAPRIIAAIQPDNLPSITLAEKIGMVRSGQVIELADLHHVIYATER